MSRLCLFLGLPAFVALTTSTVQAQETPFSALSGDWSFSFSPYIWGAGFEGDVATLPPAPPADVDASFGDILENLDIPFMGIAEIRNGRVGFLADILYIQLSTDAATPGPFFSGADAEVKSFVGTFEGSYRAVVAEQGYLDLLAGARIWSVSTELSLAAGLLAAQQRKDSDTWVDPVVGALGRLNMGSGFFLTAMGNVGGFGAASDITWDLFGGLGYQASDWFSPMVGYRHLAVDYENGDFIYDVEASGPLVGGVIRF